MVSSADPGDTTPGCSRGTHSVRNRRCALFYPTKLDDETLLLLEAEASGAFMKSELEIKADPEQALVNIVDVTKKVAQYLALQLKPIIEEHNMGADVTFSVRADGNGSFMVAQDSQKGQIVCTLRINPS